MTAFFHFGESAKFKKHFKILQEFLQIQYLDLFIFTVN